MIVRKVDLYNYYNIKRNGEEKGYLNVYCKENSYEVSFIRKYPAILLVVVAESVCVLPCLSSVNVLLPICKSRHIAVTLV